jgi:hypothetical protein
MPGIKEFRNGVLQRLQTHALPHQFDLREADLPRRRSRHGSSLRALRCARALALQRLDVARPGLQQQVLQGTPVVNGMAHFAYQVFGNVNRKPASVVPAIQNVARMLFAGQTGPAVLAHAPTAPKI